MSVKICIYPSNNRLSKKVLRPANLKTFDFLAPADNYKTIIFDAQQKYIKNIKKG